MAQDDSLIPIKDFEIKNLTDVKKHLRALWIAHNELCVAVHQKTLICTEPPDTCGEFWKDHPLEY